VTAAVVASEIYTAAVAAVRCSPPGYELAPVVPAAGRSAVVAAVAHIDDSLGPDLALHSTEDSDIEFAAAADVAADLAVAVPVANMKGVEGIRNPADRSVAECRFDAVVGQVVASLEAHSYLVARLVISCCVLPIVGFSALPPLTSSSVALAPTWRLPALFPACSSCFLPHGTPPYHRSHQLQQPQQLSPLTAHRALGLPSPALADLAQGSN
jgi:hypothetical protein